MKVPGSGGKVAPPGAVPRATTLAAWRSTCTPTRRRATAPRPRRRRGAGRRGRARHRRAHRPRHDPRLGRGERRRAGARHPAGARHRGLVQPGAGRASTCWPTCPTPTHPALVAELARARGEPRHPPRPDGRADGGRRHPRDAGGGARRGRGRRDGRSAAHRRRAGHRRRRRPPRRGVRALARQRQPLLRLALRPRPGARGRRGAGRRGSARHRAPVVGHRGAGSWATRCVEELAAAGLAGLEVHHRDHDADAVRHLTDARPLASACSSPGRATTTARASCNRLGENTTAPEVLEAIESRSRRGPRWSEP